MRVRNIEGRPAETWGASRAQDGAADDSDAARFLNYHVGDSCADDGPVLASTVTYLLPVVAVILGALVLAEPITLQLAAGVAVVLAGVALTRRKPADQPVESARPDPDTAESGSY